MRHAISAICCLIVGLQVLIGVPLIVCVAFHMLVAGDVLGPVSVEFQSSEVRTPATIPPPNRVPTGMEAVAANPLLQTRLECGSPLAGTVLEPESFDEEQSLFIAAVEKAVAEKAAEPTKVPAIEHTLPATPSLPGVQSWEASADLEVTANQFAVCQLYAMADVDEQAGKFDRADQWRSLAREIRNQSAASQTSQSAVVEALGTPPATHDATFENTANTGSLLPSAN